MIGFDQILEWVERVVAQLGPDIRHLWIEGSSTDASMIGPDAFPPEPPYRSSLSISFDDSALVEETFSRPLADSEQKDIVVWLKIQDQAVGVALSRECSEAEVIFQIADQLQDFVLDMTGGAPLPPCPGHQHPMVASVIDGIASWQCPHGNGAVTRPILS
jgi:hypothetical protein